MAVLHSLYVILLCKARFVVHGRCRLGTFAILSKHLDLLEKRAKSSYKTCVFCNSFFFLFRPTFDFS